MRESRRSRTPWKPIAAVVVVVVLLITMKVLPAGQWIESFLRYVEELGPLGYAFMIGAWIVACVFFLPGSILTLGSGAIFGLMRGFVLVSVGSTLGAAVAFIIGRFVAREWIAQKVSGNSRFRAIDGAVEKQGFKIVFLTRLSPVFPFNLLNYSLGLTGVSFWKYVLASWLGMMPGTLMYVYLGATAGDLAEAAAGGGGTGGTGQVVLKVVGLIATIVVTVYVTGIAKKALNDEVQQDSREPKVAENGT